MTEPAEIYKTVLEDILDASVILLSDIMPSDWTEANRMMSSEVSPREGLFSYDWTPYLREIVDQISPASKARIIAIMKGAQIGVSTGIIEAAIGWIISQNPGNILFLTGNSQLTEEAVEKKIDQMIDSSGLRPLIRANALRKKNVRTGDTKRSKEFPGGSLIAGSASNHSELRQRSVKYGFVDDFDSAKKTTKQSGSTRRLIEQRFAAYADTMKLFYISTPEVLAGSNIDPVYKLGDQRKYNIPCPCCGEFIDLRFELERDGNKEIFGIVWTMDKGKLVDGSVGYRCQECGQTFDEGRKQELLRKGFWKATAEPSEEGYFSYHISALYAPPGMYDWTYYVRQYLEANPVGQPRKEGLHQVFLNTGLGIPYEQEGKSPEADAVSRNVRNYKIGTIPENISIADSSGRVILLTCACDLNGTEKDARLDYEIVGWSESGSSYSIQHGSIGTFVPREGEKAVVKDRTKWTYIPGATNSVWPVLEKIIDTPFMTDNGRKINILITGIDTGHYTNHAYAFVDNTKANGVVVGLKGDKESQFRKKGIDKPLVRNSLERPNKLFIVDVNYVKDKVAESMELFWTPDNPQPPEFMNYPTPGNGLYTFSGFFEHYQAEARQLEEKDGETIGSRWKKKTSNKPNHFWDVYIYNYALKELWAMMVLKQEQKKGNWADFVALYRAKFGSK